MLFDHDLNDLMTNDQSIDNVYCFCPLFPVISNQSMNRDTYIYAINKIVFMFRTHAQIHIHSHTINARREIVPSLDNHLHDLLITHNKLLTVLYYCK